MRKKLSSTSREEILRAIVERYSDAKRSERRIILDRFVSVTGYHRKHATRLLRSRASEPARTRKSRVRLYDEDHEI